MKYKNYEYLENEEGVHVIINGVGGGEFTACGFSFDEDVGHGILRKTDKQKVTCEECIRVIKLYKAIKL